MAFDQNLATRVENYLIDKGFIEEKPMFGGLGFILNGNMACGVHKEFLIVRVGPDEYKNSLKKEFTREFDITGRSMTGWVMVEPEGYADDENLQKWIDLGLKFAATLPEK